ncbi:hypothetical protein [Sandaracinus amylolyticus]|uniref:hypothetical protein n=1 Tax=Sandaracinus amylolyticus TaxID=927083 RepID=UPI001F42DBBD|nr:hypothetical protein [Sandaracinus amylolyticus]UJR78719.1 Hypothetical protein I5071_7500 [Sandaracinus amylolyticus]
MSRAPAFFLFFALASLPALASAQTDDAIEEARTALRNGDPELAIDVLEEARETSGDPALRYELYLAHHQAGQHAQAASHLEAYLASDPAIDEHERARLEGHLADLRALDAPRPSGDPLDDPAVPIIGWTLFAGGILGLITFAVGGVVAFTIENGSSEPCREEGACAPGELDGVDEAWTAAWIGLASGVVLGAVGGVLLVLAGERQRGGSRSLPPDLDPSLQRPFSLAPWVDPVRGAGGMRAHIAF